ncbi:MAG: amidohydrolase family protein [Flavisolibacter sp.]|jgi:imidazolonepropionase-like amidohydrolase|nr:amidohydrolase family protein [Flavisolibacter sp.]
MKPVYFFFLFLVSFSGLAQTDSFYLLKPDRVFDGEAMHNDWIVLVKGNHIEAAGSMNFKLPANTRIIELKGTTLLPGLIEGHSHLFLHPYNETPWNDQVLKESRAERTARAVTHARATLMAGFTTVRDLGTEGAMYDDVGLKIAIEKGIVPGPRMIIATRAIVAKGTYGPNYDNPDIDLPQGAEEVAGIENMTEAVRSQIGKGADVIKIYADYRWGKSGEALPTFSAEAIGWATAIAKSGGRQVVVHASTKEGMKRSIAAGVATIEHGDNGDEEIFTLMKQKGVALCATLAAGDAVLKYGGWKKGIDPEPAKITAKKKSFAAALKSGVAICMGGDVGVYAHGDNAREMELMVEYGMKPVDVLKSATSINADVFGYSDKIGRIKKGLLADIIAVQGDPSGSIKAIRQVSFVMKDGKIYKQ